MNKSILLVALTFFSILPSVTLAMGDEACFYRFRNQQVLLFCLPVGTTVENLIGSGYNEKISSISLNGVSSVTLCAQPNFWGLCETFTESQSSLPPMLDNRVTSIEVR